MLKFIERMFQKKTKQKPSFNWRDANNNIVRLLNIIGEDKGCRTCANLRKEDCEKCKVSYFELWEATNSWLEQRVVERIESKSW